MKFEFTVNGLVRKVDTSPMRRLLDVLRQDLGLMGAKEGCGEGECGACAVLLDGKLVNSCMVPALQLPGRRVETIEALAPEGRPDALQQAFLDAGAVQCGFCTPGMVMAARALLARNPAPSRDEIRVGIAGNLCRCTGYESIVDAVERAASAGYSPRLDDSLTGRAEIYLDEEEKGRVFSPCTLEEALDVMAELPGEVVLVAGGTDLLVDVEKKGRPLPRSILDLGGVDDLKRIKVTGDWLEIGAGATFAEIATNPDVRAVAPMLADCASQVGAVAIQNRATIGGNIATASAAADSPPVLMALGAKIVAARRGGVREMPMDGFISGYRRTALQDDELLAAIRIPLDVKGCAQMFRKVGLRRALAISRVSLACAARIQEGVVTRCRIYAGSMSPVPLFLEEASGLVVGKTLSVELAKEAGRLAEKAVSPRTSPEYRKDTTGKLTTRFFKDILAGTCRPDR